LIEQVSSDSGDIAVLGLSAFLIGTCYVFQDGDTKYTRQQLHQVIMSRIGLDQFFSKLQKLRSDKRFLDWESNLLFNEVVVLHVNENLGS
jgi:hypothetical protein